MTKVCVLASFGNEQVITELSERAIRYNYSGILTGDCTFIYKKHSYEMHETEIRQH